MLVIGKGVYGGRRYTEILCTFCLIFWESKIVLKNCSLLKNLVMNIMVTLYYTGPIFISAMHLSRPRVAQGRQSIRLGFSM